MEKITIILIILAIIIILIVGLYNSLIKLKNRVKEAWSDIDVQLKRRYELIPNLMGAVKGYMKHEEGVLTKVTEARSKAMNAQGTEEKAEAENIKLDLERLFKDIDKSNPFDFDFGGFEYFGIGDEE